MRCAIYTRKSTVEGLDQDFNTLDAQREACENYVQSLKHEGWTFLSEHYDDGGYTGANIERPALKRLIEDIELNKIDCVVVYKIDRLSRSLSDFVKLIEYFDKHKVAYVSITQHFNTNSSMGRLTLNILLSFAQFERDIISERTKDKMLAARKRGQWTGGFPVLGYYIIEKKLIINKEEAELVKQIFNLYLIEKSALRVAKVLNQQGFKTKEYTSRNNISYGNNLFCKADILNIISNVLYIGKTKCNSSVFNGEHEGIITEEVFNKAQEIKEINKIKRHNLKTIKNVALLKNLLWCKYCNKLMTPTYSSKTTKKYRYYLCINKNKFGYDFCKSRSVNANEIESEVIASLKKIIVKENLNQANIILSEIWDSLFSYEKRRLLNLIVDKIYFDGINKRIEINLNKKGLKELEHEVRV